MHEVLVNRLGGLSLPRKSVVRLTDRPDMTLDVYRGRKTTMQQRHSINFTLAKVHDMYCNDKTKLSACEIRKCVVKFGSLAKVNTHPHICVQIARNQIMSSSIYTGIHDLKRHQSHPKHEPCLPLVF